MKSSPNYNLLQ